MCLSKKSRTRDRRKNFPKIDPSQTKKFQQKLIDYYQHHSNGTEMYERNLEPVGDPLIDKDPTHIRFLFQNINGLKLGDGFEVAPEITVMGALQGDVVGYMQK